MWTDSGLHDTTQPVPSLQGIHWQAGRDSCIGKTDLVKGQMRQLAPQFPDAFKDRPGSLHDIGSRCSLCCSMLWGSMGFMLD